MRNIKHSIWETIEVGTYKTVDELKEEIKYRCIRNDFAESIFESSNFILSKEHKKVKLAIVSPYTLLHSQKLDFEFFISFEDICKFAIKLGLKLCPAETGPQICLQSKKLQRELNLFIAMEPIFIPTTIVPCIFYLNRQYDYSKLNLDGHCGRPKGVWSKFTKFVFIIDDV